jgi:hypothetical protein
MQNDTSIMQNYTMQNDTQIMQTDTQIMQKIHIISAKLHWNHASKKDQFNKHFFYLCPLARALCDQCYKAFLDCWSLTLIS